MFICEDCLDASPVSSQGKELALRSRGQCEECKEEGVCFDIKPEAGITEKGPPPARTISKETALVQLGKVLGAIDSSSAKMGVEDIVIFNSKVIRQVIVDLTEYVANQE